MAQHRGVRRWSDRCGA